MDDRSWLIIVITLGVLLLLALFFAGAETAASVLGEGRLGRKAEEGDKKARTLLALARVGRVLFHPAVWLTSKLVKADAEEVSEEEIRMMVDIGEEKGAIERDEKEMIENIFEFNNRTAEDVMIHRTDVVMLWADDSSEEILHTIEETGISRYPVYEEDADDVIGILNSRDWFLNARRKEPKPLRELLRPAYFVPESVRADVLFRDMQSRKVHIAVVVDEYGGTSGIVTMEDLLEEIVGNIYDEFDPQDEQEIFRLGENLWRIAGSAELEEVAEALGLELPEEEEYDTLGGLIFAQLSVIPEDGSQIELDVWDLHIQVTELADRRVEWALVSRRRPEETGKDEPGESARKPKEQ